MPALYRKIYLLFFAFLAAFALAFIMPHVATNEGDGLAGGATAAVSFLGFALVAVVLALWLAALVGRNHRYIRRITLIVGVLPILIVVAVGFRVWHDLQQGHTIVVPAPSTTTTPPPP